MIRRKNSFTLVEVVTALAILSLGVVSYLTLANMAQRRLIKARERWTNFHVLSQGVEYFMLQNSEDPDPPDLEFFDYPGYMVQCRYEELGEELPEELTSVTPTQAELRACVIELVRVADGSVVDSVTIDRIQYDNNTDSAMR